MANIIQRITLAGAEEIRAQLRAISAAGKDAFDKLSDTRGINDRLATAGVSLGKLAADVKTFGNNAKAAGEAGVAFGNAVGNSLTRITGIAAAAGLAFGKLVETVKGVGAAAEELDQNAAAAGLTTKAYESLTNALGVNGVGSTEAGKALDKAAKFLVAAKDQTDDYEKKLKKLNEENRKGTLSFKDYSEKLKDLNDGMGSAAKLAKEYKLKLTDTSGELVNVRDFALQFGEALKESGKATKDNAAALEVFGKAGRKIGQAFGQGREAIEALELRAQTLAPSLTEGAQKAVTGMDDAFDQLGQTSKSLTRELVSIFAPSITAGVTAFTEAIARNRFLFLEFAETLDRQLRPALLSVLNQLNSTDFATTIQAAFTTASNAVKAFATAVKTFVIPAVLGIKAGADQVATVINKIFGTELTGGAILFGAVLLKITGLFSVFTTGLGFAFQAFKLLSSSLPVAINLFRVLSAVLRANPIIALAVAVGILVGLILRAFPQIGVAFKQFIEDPVASIKAAWNGLANFFGTFIENVKIIFAAVGFAIRDAFLFGVEKAKAFFQPLTDAVSAVVEAVKTAWNGTIKFFTDLFESIGKVFSDAWAALKQTAIDTWNAISDSITAPFQKIKDTATAMFNFVSDLFNKLIDKVKEFLGLQAQAGSDSGGDSTPGFARGGVVRGPGTTTSDSIWAKLSDQEFVVKAKAVRHYGANVFHALNNMRIPKFANGGQVMASMAQQVFTPSIPRFAGGGLVAAPTNAGGGGRPFVLNIGGESIGGLTANGAAVEALQRYASQKAVRTAGRKPQWFKG